MTQADVVMRLAGLRTREDAQQLLDDYAVAIAGFSGDPASAVRTAEANVGWLLGELSGEERERALLLLPDRIAHPVSGRRAGRPPDAQLITEGALWAAGQIGFAPAGARLVLRLDDHAGLPARAVPIEEALAAAARDAVELRWQRVEGGFEAELARLERPDG